MSLPTVMTEIRMLRIYAHSLEEAIAQLPVGVARNEAVAALATVDQGIAERRDCND